MQVHWLRQHLVLKECLVTNPIAVAIPADEQPPFVADFATTTAANGKLEILQRKNEDAPLGWVQDKNGNASTDANELKQGGALLPLGSDKQHGSHKGYALGSIVDIFSAVLSGASYGPWAPPFPAYVPMPENMPGKGLGIFLAQCGLMHSALQKNLSNIWITGLQRFRKAKPADGYDKVLIPGDPEREMELIRMKEGIPVVESVVEELKNLAKQFNIETGF